ncbi:MAG: sugar ABC transporter ATP-binding protein [Lachnospiraceae bacterium]|nr:sugar ABC transporter ATP-binding protein [Lachnospiraceae bacterium]
MEEQILLRTLGLSKNFGDVKALTDVSLDIRRGEIQGLIGENGSGKSTISSIIFGIHKASAGTMELKGSAYSPKSPMEARQNGISMIVQEKDTIDMLSVAENIFLGDEKEFKKGPLVDTARMNAEAKKALSDIGITDIDVTEPVYKLNFETRKLIEIAKALYYKPELIIIDETTTALSQDGRMKIYEIMKKQKEAGKAVLFISHDLPELIETCDCLTVLRDGSFVRKIEKIDFSENEIKKSMVGRTVAENLYRSDFDGRLSDEVAVSVKAVSTNLLKDITLDLHEGEILGLGGLSGSGMHELGRVLAGLDRCKKGEVTVYGEKLRGVAHALKMKIGYISKDRDIETLFLAESIQDNLTISAWNILKKGFLILPRDEKRFAREQIDSLKIKCSSEKQLVRELSGGNKQKVSFGKLIGNGSKIMVLDSPTRGVDVGVKTTMYELINNLKKEGHAIVIISEELPELIGMCDRILILKDGEKSKEFERKPELKETDIINYLI